MEEVPKKPFFLWRIIFFPFWGLVYSLIICIILITLLAIYIPIYQSPYKSTIRAKTVYGKISYLEVEINIPRRINNKEQADDFINHFESLINDVKKAKDNMRE